MLSSDSFCWLAPGFVVPLAALEALLALERAGHSVGLDGDDLVVDRGRGCPSLDQADLDQLRRWKAHAWLIVRHCLSDTTAQRQPVTTRKRATSARDARTA